MNYRISKISKVECKVHSSPILAWDYLNLNLLCGDCDKSKSQIKIQNIRDDIVTYYNVAKVQRQNGFQQLEQLKLKMNEFLQNFQNTVEENFKSIKSSLVNLIYFSDIEQQWINDTTTAVSFEDLTKLVKIWGSVYYCEDNKSKIREQFNNTIQQINDKMQNFCKDLENYGRQSIIIPNPHPPNPHPPNPHFPIPDTIQIVRLQNLEQDLKKFPNYSVCHFKVLKQCKLKKFLMPPVKENVKMIFGFHKEIDTDAITTQEFDFLQNQNPHFYEINQEIILRKNQNYTLSLQLKDKQKQNFQFFQYSGNSPKNEYLEFIDNGYICQQWGTSNQLYFTKGLFSSLIIEIIE